MLFVLCCCCSCLVVDSALNKYRAAISEAYLSANGITNVDLQLFAHLRSTYSITLAQHTAVVRELDVSEDEWQLVVSSAANKETAKVNECVVCLSAPSTFILVPCGHVCLCAECAVQFIPVVGEVPQCCPNCRKTVQSVLKTFM